MKNVTLSTLRSLNETGEKFTVLTAYDSTMADLVSSNGVEVILVGDSLGMVVQGKASTLPVTIDHMVYHTECVAAGNKGALIMADMPFASYGDPHSALKNAALLMQAGAHMVKVEGKSWLKETVSLLANNGIPVCVHLGLTPQSVNKFGGYKVQGRGDEGQELINDAVELTNAGADIALLECVPSPLGKAVTDALHIPVIGIGAGADCDAQVLVSYDMLGLGSGHKPKFVKDFMATANSPAQAIKNYVAEVKAGQFPNEAYEFNA